MFLHPLGRRERGLLFTFLLLTLIAFFGPALPAADVAIASVFADDRRWHGLPVLLALGKMETAWQATLLRHNPDAAAPAA